MTSTALRACSRMHMQYYSVSMSAIAANSGPFGLELLERMIERCIRSILATYQLSLMSGSVLLEDVDNANSWRY